MGAAITYRNNIAVLPDKDPESVIPVAINLKTHPGGDYLEAGEIVSQVDWSIDGPDAELKLGDGVTTVSTPAGDVIPSAPLAPSDGLLVAWIYGGTAGSEYTVTASFRLNTGKFDQRSLIVPVEER